MQRIVTNRTLFAALHEGVGPLTRTQRIGFFLCGLASLFGGLGFVAASFAIPAEVHHISQVRLFNIVFDMPLVVGTAAIGVSAMVLGLRTLRHVIWKARIRDSH